MSQATLKSVNAAIQKLGGAEQLVRGDGYHYFVGGVADELTDYPSIYVCYTSHFTLDQWIEEWKNLKSVAEQKLQERADLLNEPDSDQRFRIKNLGP
jgi:hypothetical protein